MRRLRYWLTGPLSVAIAFLIATRSAAASPLLLDYTTRGGAVIGAARYPYGEHVPRVDYTVGIEEWVVALDPDPPKYLRSGDGTFLDTLSAAFPAANGWNYSSSANELSNDSLVVRKYAARHWDSGVGAVFLAEYVPHAGDPAAADVHWIQVITNNHKRLHRHGTPERRVDHRFDKGPYYDQGGAANSRFFYDFPDREDYNEHDWEAFLFLVTAPPVIAQPDGFLYPTPGDVTIYGGIHWGWENRCINDCDSVPEPGPVILLATGAAGLLVRLRRSRSRRSRVPHSLLCRVRWWCVHSS